MGVDRVEHAPVDRLGGGGRPALRRGDVQRLAAQQPGVVPREAVDRVALRHHQGYGAQAARTTADHGDVHRFLEPGVVADVVLDGGWRRHVHVSHAGDPVLVRSIEGGTLLPGTLRFCPAALEWRVGSRAARLDGVLTAHGDGFALTPVGAAHTIQRRRFVRVAAELPAALVAEDRRVLARTRNVSIGGMLLAGVPDLRLDERLRFALELGEDATVAGTGRVVRGAPDGTRGVQFEDLDGRSERALARFVTERQRSLAAAL
ncbi:hypothetical protein C7Y72_00025 [Paraconexibacter algicola]|uniref:PilZ domain-containing protein n=1 Tax=Paraconexibacter algicola TaxID=2133960 RepID=A0A2T4UG39_9ACTN|nr:hypothetical protein C7Y72_00025 [Paraconexibacter algicola]